MTQGLERFSLEDEIVVVTGGNSRYGKSIVSAAAATGATVITTSRTTERAEELASEERKRGHSVEGIKMDLTDMDSIRAFCNHVEDTHGSIDGLVNNAVSRPMDDLHDEINAWRDSMEANATGMFELTRRIATNMSEYAGGSIVNVGSIQGMVGPDLTLYEETDLYGDGSAPPPDYFFHKGGLINLTRYFASVYGPEDVRVNCVSPGGIASEGQDTQFVENYEKKTNLGRLADGSDLSGVIVFLLSDAAKYISGANIPVDGGYTAK